MKLDKIKFARLIGFISCRYALTMTADDIDEIDKLIEFDAPEPQTVYPNNENIERLMMLMAEGTRKIDAIREHRAITGFGLKESKDAVERHWPDNSEKWTKEELRKYWEKTLMSQADSDAVLKFIESLS